jgi:phosphate transport system substrate-binding protein
LLLSCSDTGDKKAGGEKKEIETTTQGAIGIAVDESLKPVMEQELKVFDSSFPKVDIRERYESEQDCFNQLFQDSVRLIVVTRDLTVEERLACKKRGIVIKSLPLALDAIALIVHPGSPDTLMTMGQFRQILLGKFARSYNIVFDNARSGTVRYITDSLIPGQALPANAYALNTNEAVVDYVEKNEHALGILGAGHVYDPEDGSGIGLFRKGIRVVALRDDSTGEFFQPYQAYLALGQYALSRPVYFISRENWQGPATGFANFLSGARGQLIFKNARMVPLRVALRIREVNLK